MATPNGDNNVVDITAPNYATELALLGTTGRLTYAPKGADVAPLANMGAYAAPYVDLGWISDAGITESMSEEVNDFTPWQTTSSIRTSTASQEFTFSAVVWSIGGLANALYYGVAEDDMAYDEATGVTTFTQGGELPENMRFVLSIDVVDGEKARRFILPSCSVQERGDITYTRTEMVGYEFTFKANIDSELGYAVMRQFKEGWKPGTAGSTLENTAGAGSLGEWHEDVNARAEGE